MVGINPRPLTLRQLDWMATARNRAEWSRTVSTVLWLYRAGSGATLGVEDIAPGVFDEDDLPDDEFEKTADQVEFENKLAWGQMHQFFTGKGAT